MIRSERQIKIGPWRKNRHLNADPKHLSLILDDRGDRGVAFEKITGILFCIGIIGIITCLFSQVYFIFGKTAQINKRLQSTLYFVNFRC
jgi:hypothetical protein